MTLVRSQLFRALRACFRAVPLSESTRDALRARFLRQFPTVRPLPAQGQLGDARERRPRVHSGGRAIGYVEYSEEPLPDPLPATLVAFYLPQFHTIPENDAWWGKGFTEWRNVARALPQFEGHQQPRLPGDLGFYDLRNPQVMRDQAKLAKTYGLSAFCFYFYWFGGKTLLEEPLRNWLADKSIDFQYCLCWANENWSRRWDGRDDEILIAQQHSPEDDIAFIAHVAEYLRDPRYLRVEGKPLLLLYRPGLLPDARATAERWRSWCRDNGVGEIQLAYVQSFERPNPADIGFDAAVEFPPNLSNPNNLTADLRLLNPEFEGQVLDWRELAADYSARPMPTYPLYPGVNAGWDNEPRRPGKGRVYLHSSPRLFRDWLHTTIAKRLAGKVPSGRLVFINAWNEWAEGAILEPDTAIGHAWLSATRKGLIRAVEDSTPGISKQQQPCAVVHAWYPDVFDEIVGSLLATNLDWRLVVTTTSEKSKAIRNCLAKRGMQAEIKIVENRGRDILPFLQVASELLDEGVGVVLKLHTKRSDHRPDGDKWRRELIDRLASPERAGLIARAFHDDKTLGLVGPHDHLQPLGPYRGGNDDALAYLAARIGLTPVRDDVTFVAGSMYWVRLEAIRLLIDAHLQPSDFRPENADIDGTLAHAIERVVAVCATHSGWHVKDTTSVFGEAVPSKVSNYRYAKRN